MNRADLQKLAELRIEEARILLKAKKYAGAYYLAGYAVEFAFKACIARKTRKYAYPDKDLATRCYTHNVEKLVDIAELKALLLADAGTEPALEANWTIVKDWDEQARFERKTTQAQAKALYDAITDSAHGVLQWIKSHW